MLPLPAFVVGAALAVVGYALLAIVRLALFPSRPAADAVGPPPVGDVTLRELAKYDGRDPFLPLLLAVRGAVYDVTPGRAFYGPGAGYAVFAGRECARALATMDVSAAACDADVGGLTPKQAATLADWEAKLSAKYKIVGRVVPERRLTRAQLAAHDGREPGKPLLLAVRGVVLDVTPGRHFYGAGGPYPFAGKECARALARFSVAAADCTGDLAGCSPGELEVLRDWEERLISKYRVVGRLVEE